MLYFQVLKQSFRETNQLFQIAELQVYTYLMHISVLYSIATMDCEVLDEIIVTLYLFEAQKM
jgi:hypothetical protein